MAQRIGQAVIRRLRAAARIGLARGQAAARGVRAERERRVQAVLGRLPVATAQRLLILDGAALNVQVRLPPSAGPAPAGAGLVLARGSHRYHVPLRLHPAADGEPCTASGMVALAALHDQGPGRWLLGLRLSDVDGTVTYHGLYGTPQPGDVPAPDRCPTTGTGYALGCTARGRASLTLAPPRPCTQVTRVVTGWDGVSVTGRVIAADSKGPASVTMSHRGGRVSLPVSLDGGRFRFTVPPDAIPAGRARWRFSLATGGSGPVLPVGRYLNDPPHPDRVIGYPARTLPDQTGGLARRVRVQPAYSARGRLLLTCSDLEESS